MILYPMMVSCCCEHVHSVSYVHSFISCGIFISS